MRGKCVGLKDQMRHKSRAVPSVNGRRGTKGRRTLSEKAMAEEFWSKIPVLLLATGAGINTMEL